MGAIYGSSYYTIVDGPRWAEAEANAAADTEKKEKTDLKNDQKISLGSTKSHKGKDFKETSNPTRHKTINNPIGRLIKNDLSDGFLNDFIPENMNLAPYRSCIAKTKPTV